MYGQSLNKSVLIDKKKDPIYFSKEILPKLKALEN
tara:strand:- start:321 stop:425 length:105 start_codon:yes stop_codon:yes gene_type:complete